MEEITASPSPPPPQPPTAAGTKTKPATSRFKKEILSLAVSLQEGFRYMKATVVGQAKKITAKNEKEATAADLQTSKMQVEAADAAEKKKQSIQK